MERKDVVDFLIKVEEIAKIGLKYTKDPYAKDNYLELQNLAKTFLEEKENIFLNSPNFFKRDIYPTPSLSVRTIIFDETRTKVLLVQERSDLGYSLPGGWTELTLSPSESAKKEVREEAGAECEIVRLVGVTDRYKDIETTGVPEYVLTFEGRLVSEIGESCHEIVSKDFFDIDNLPPFSCKNVENQMKKLIYAARDNKTIFD